MYRAMLRGLSKDYDTRFIQETLKCKEQERNRNKIKKKRNTSVYFLHFAKDHSQITALMAMRAVFMKNRQSGSTLIVLKEEKRNLPHPILESILSD